MFCRRCGAKLTEIWGKPKENKWEYDEHTGRAYQNVYVALECPNKGEKLHWWQKPHGGCMYRRVYKNGEREGLI